MEETKENPAPLELDVMSFRKPLSVCDLGKEYLGLHHTFGNDFTRRNNISLIEDDKIIYAAGNNVIIETLSTGAKDYLLAIDEGGVGAVAVHPSKKLFAVACKGVQPNIYIYSFPEIKLHKVLRDGAERGYSCLAFNKAGTELASVASAPDFMLTIWLWDQEKIFLHAKAFGQEVYNVRFSQDDNRRLTTSGTGHIRFWKMASTFTGQKLQGSIGKFGKVDLTDISAFVEFPNGKVCSGTENGALLIWEGNFIKCRLVRKNGLLCHDGEVVSVELDRNQNCLVTAGDDGYIRWWCMKIIDTAEVDADHSIDFEIEPLFEYKNPNGKGIKALFDNSPALEAEKSLYLLDSAGQFSLTKFQYNASPGIPEGTQTKILSAFHGSGITGMTTSPNSYLAASCSSDGRIIVSNFQERVTLCTTLCEVGATSIMWVPLHVEPSGQSIVVGCANGTLKMFKIVPNSAVSDESPELYMLVQTRVFKPHTKAINAVSFSRSSAVMATAGLDGMVFFFDCKPAKEWVPLRFVTMSVLEEGKVPTYCTSMSWSGACILLGCSDGLAREVDANVIIVEANEESHSFEAVVQPKCIAVSVPVTVPAAVVVAEGGGEEQAAEDQGPVTTLVPAKITKCVYSFAEANNSHDQFFMATSGVTGQQFFKGVFNSDVVGKELTLGLYSADGKDMRKAPAVTCMEYSNDREFLVMGAADGSVMIRPTNFIEVFSSVTAHNSACGGVAAVRVSFDSKFILSVGYDGLLVVHRFIHVPFLAKASPLCLDLEAGVFGDSVVKPYPTKVKEPRHLQCVSSTDPPLENDVENVSHTIVAIEDLQVAENIDSSAYSIQDNKLRSESDNQKSAAEIKKDKIRQIVAKLRREFDDLRYHNDQLPEVIRLSMDELCIDGKYFEILDAEGKKMIEEVKLECEYEAEKALTLRRKMFARLMTDVMVEEMPLYGFREKKPPKVLSLRTIGMDKSLQDGLEAVHQSIREDEHNLSKARVLEELDYMDKLEQVDKDGADKSADKQATSKNVDKLGSSSHASGLHARREARQLRIEKLKKHDLEKPKENEDDTRDIEAILHAEKTIGSYSLKCADDYRVPEDQVINANKKKRQMLMLQESMITLRLKFNERFLKMRKLKQQIVESIQQGNSRIREIDAQLNEANCSVTYQPKLLPSEFPDDRDLMTKQEILDFKTKRKTIEWKKAAAPPNSILRGDATTLDYNAINGLYVVKAKIPDDFEKVEIDFDPASREVAAAEDAAGGVSSSASISSASTSTSSLAPAKSALQIIDFYGCGDIDDLHQLEVSIPVLLAAKDYRKSYLSDNSYAEVSDERKAAISEHKRALIFEKQSLIKKAKKHMDAFDENIHSLRLERHHLSGDLKLAELQLLTLYQEYGLLLGFEDKDNALRQKEERCKRETQEIQLNITDFQSKYEAKLEDQGQWQTKSATLMSEFRVLVPENNPFFDILTKIFKKKIKRSKGTDDLDGDEEDSEEEEDDDDDDYDDDEVEDVCPSGCDATLYDKVLEFREKRLDIEEVLTEIQKVIDDLKKSLDRFRGRAKQIEKESRSAEAEMQSLQLSKQTALNKIEVCVPLKVSQLHTFRNSGAMSGPDEEGGGEKKEEDAAASQVLNDHIRRQMVDTMGITSHTLFNSSNLDKLSRRIGELKNEIVAAKVDLKSFHKEKVRLEKERGAQRANIENWTDKCNELQMLKFGQLIDLDVLEKGSDHSKLEEAEAAVTRVESEYQVTMRQLQDEYDTLNERLAKTTATNTQHLKQMGNLVDRKLCMTRELNLPKDSFAADPQLTDYKDSIERSKLTAFVKLQYREIDSLKSEITMLRRKETAQFAAFLPPAPAMSMTSGTGLGGVSLPPIHNKRLESKSANGGLRPQGSADEIFGSQTTAL